RPCGASSCAGGVETTSPHCDGYGTCALADEVDCAPFACGEFKCRTACAQSDDCAPGFVCIGSTCAKPGQDEVNDAGNDASMLVDESVKESGGEDATEPDAGPGVSPDASFGSDAGTKGHEAGTGPDGNSGVEGSCGCRTVGARAEPGGPARDSARVLALLVT